MFRIAGGSVYTRPTGTNTAQTRESTRDSKTRFATDVVEKRATRRTTIPESTTGGRRIRVRISRLKCVRKNPPVVQGLPACKKVNQKRVRRVYSSIHAVREGRRTKLFKETSFAEIWVIPGGKRAP